MWLLFYIQPEGMHQAETFQCFGYYSFGLLCVDMIASLHLARRIVHTGWFPSCVVAAIYSFGLSYVIHWPEGLMNTDHYLSHVLATIPFV